MAQVQDIILGGLNLTVLPGGYGKRNKRTGGRPASFERLRIDTFSGQRQAFGAADRRLLAADFAWDGLGVGPVFDGQGIEPFPNVASFADGNLATRRAPRCGPMGWWPGTTPSSASAGASTRAWR